MKLKKILILGTMLLPLTSCSQMTANYDVRCEQIYGTYISWFDKFEVEHKHTDENRCTIIATSIEDKDKKIKFYFLESTELAQMHRKSWDELNKMSGDKTQVFKSYNNIIYQYTKGDEEMLEPLNYIVIKALGLAGTIFDPFYGKYAK